MFSRTPYNDKENRNGGNKERRNSGAADGAPENPGLAEIIKYEKNREIF